MVDCGFTEKVLQRALAGVPVGAGELDAALAHVAACAVCGRRFELERLRSYAERSDALADMAEPVEPIALFERALIGALSDPEAIVRMRAAERLGGFERLGPVALDALAQTAAEDPDEEVRAAALVALDRLDKEVSIPQRLIESWSATPAEAAPYLADVLARLAAWPAPSSRVTELVATPTGAAAELAVRGEEGITGRLGREKKQLWLKLHELPAVFENQRPVVAVPNALEKDAPPIRWSGDSPGLVAARAPVLGGALDVLLGSVPGPSLREGGLPEKLFGRLYLLTPREQRAGL